MQTGNCDGGARAPKAKKHRMSSRFKVMLTMGALLTLTALLAACGGSSSSSSSEPPQSGETAPVEGGSSTTEGASSETGGVSGEEVRKVLNISSKDTGEGEKWNIGAVLALTGPGAAYGKVMTRGIELASAQIKAAGGPEISVEYKDHKSGNAQAGAQAGRELGIAGTPAVLSSYAGVIGSLFPSLEQYKMLGVDPGGGTSDFGQGIPYFWGTRAIEPDDAFTGALKYWKATDPSIKRVSMVFIDQGPINETVEGNFKKAAEGVGLEDVGNYTTAIETSDYTSTIAKVKSSGAEAVYLFLIGEGIGNFMKQYANAGLELPVIGSEFQPEAAKIAGPAIEKYDWATDWFFANEPSNPWSELFVKSYQERFGEEAEVWSANFYESTFLLWELYMRVKEEGGDVNSGEDLQKALEKDPHFPSVYGGSANEVGKLSLSLKTHSVESRPLAVLAYNGGEPKKLATFELGGKNFQLVE